jgi:hypothetical protein
MQNHFLLLSANAEPIEGQLFEISIEEKEEQQNNEQDIRRGETELEDISSDHEIPFELPFDNFIPFP